MWPSLSSREFSRKICCYLNDVHCSRSLHFALFFPPTPCYDLIWWWVCPFHSNPHNFATTVVCPQWQIWDDAISKLIEGNWEGYMKNLKEWQAQYTLKNVREDLWPFTYVCENLNPQRQHTPRRQKKNPDCTQTTAESIWCKKIPC